MLMEMKETVVKHQTGWAHWPAYVRGTARKHTAATQKELCGPDGNVGAPHWSHWQEIIVILSKSEHRWHTTSFLETFSLYMHTHAHRDYIILSQPAIQLTDTLMLQQSKWMNANTASINAKPHCIRVINPAGRH